MLSRGSTATHCKNERTPYATRLDNITTTLALPPCAVLCGASCGGFPRVVLSVRGAAVRRLFASGRFFSCGRGRPVRCLSGRSLRLLVSLACPERFGDWRSIRFAGGGGFRGSHCWPAITLYMARHLCAPIHSAGARGARHRQSPGCHLTAGGLGLRPPAAPASSDCAPPRGSARPHRRRLRAVRPSLVGGPSQVPPRPPGTRDWIGLASALASAPAPPRPRYAARSSRRARVAAISPTASWRRATKCENDLACDAKHRPLVRDIR